MAETELKPCPFCGGEAFINERYNSIWRLEPTDFTVLCKDCKAGVRHYFSTRAEAIEAWNRRTMMTDNEIIKALEYIASEDIGDCKRDCCFYDGKVHFCGGIVAKHSIDIINRQKAEIERLNGCVKTEEEVRLIATETIQQGIKTIRADAIKEFAELLKEKRGLYGEIWDEYIDKLVKEMVGDNDGENIIG